MYKKYYSQFLQFNKGVQHFACHSHYYWPDVTKNAVIQYWNDSARLVDAKWEYFFSEKLPKLSKYISKVLNTSNPEQIAFASNTHEFIVRILSCFPPHKPLRILTTDSEFHSFERQINRISEFDHIYVKKVETLPANNFAERFKKEINENDYDLIFFSHVFFNSGIVVDKPEEIVNTVKNKETIIVVDGYHAFMAVPIDIKPIENRIFYMAGSYKYAQGGEGCCFLHVPANNFYRPWNTGWFADFDSLEGKHSDKINYQNNGMKFMGATMDFTAVYRLLSVFELFEKEGITQNAIQEHIRFVQMEFLKEISKYDHPLINKSRLLYNNLEKHGHFFSFLLDSNEQVGKLAGLLKEYKIITDFRGNRIRFGFALYHDGKYDLSVLNTRRAYFFDEFLFS